MKIILEEHDVTAALMAYIGDIVNVPDGQTASFELTDDNGAILTLESAGTAAPSSFSPTPEATTAAPAKRTRKTAASKTTTPTPADTKALETDNTAASTATGVTASSIFGAEAMAAAAEITSTDNGDEDDAIPFTATPEAQPAVNTMFGTPAEAPAQEETAAAPFASIFGTPAAN